MTNPEHPKLNNLTQEQIDTGIKKVKMTEQNVVTAIAELELARPILSAALLSANNTVKTTWGSEGSKDFTVGVAAAHMLLNGLVETTGVVLYPETNTGHLEDDALANYGFFERIQERNRTWLDRIEGMTTHSDWVAEMTSVREFEADYPLWFSAATRLSARRLVRPVHYFDNFMADGRLAITDEPMSLEDFNASSGRLSEVEDADAFLLFTEGFADVTRLILASEVKRDFEQDF